MDCAAYECALHWFGVRLTTLKTEYFVLKSALYCTISMRQKPEQFDKDKKIGYEFLALFSALIWGTSFVAQKSAMLAVPPLTFTALRFLSALPVLLLMLWFFEARFHHIQKAQWRRALFYSLPPGLAVACAASLQQMGLVSSSASKGGFIISLYVCIVPFLAVLTGYRIRLMEISAALLAVAGLYLLIVSDAFIIEAGDILLVASACAWAFHILSIDYSLRYVRPLLLAVFHIGYCILLVALAAFLFEEIGWNSVQQVRWELFYAGPLAAGLSLGLQIVCQEYVSPNRISLLVCMAVFFAALGGWLVLGELLTLREWGGCALMVLALFIVRIRFPARNATS